jgi:hypothetical protein
MDRTTRLWEGATLAVARGLRGRAILCKGLFLYVFLRYNTLITSQFSV